MSQSVSPCFAPVSKYVRIPAAYVLSGMTYICDNCCCTSQYLGDEVSVFTQRKPIASSVASQNLTMTVFDIVGRKGIQVEVVGELEYKPDNGATVYHLVFSGFGTWDAKNQRISQVSGKFAGTASGVYYSEGNCETEVSVPAWSVCDLLPDYDASSVVFGSWSMRYDAAATKKMSR